jgi:hypothetical protein
MPAMNRFLAQAIEERFNLADTLRGLGEVVGQEIPEEELGGEALSLPTAAAARA